MALTRGQATFEANTFEGDGTLRGTSTTVFQSGTGSNLSTGHIAAAGARAVMYRNIDGYIGKVNTFLLDFHSATNNATGNLVLRAITKHAHEMTETGMCGAYYTGTSAWDTGYSLTTGSSSHPGHDAGVQKQAVAAPLTNATFYFDSVDVLNEAIKQIIIDGRTGENADIALMVHHEDEQGIGNGFTTAIVARENGSLTNRPHIYFTVSLFPYGFGIKSDEESVQVTDTSFTARLTIGEYSWQSGDSVQIEWSLDPDLSESIITDEVDLTGYEENDILDIPINHNYSNKTIYWRTIFIVSGVTYNGEIISALSANEIVDEQNFPSLSKIGTLSSKSTKITSRTVAEQYQIRRKDRQESVITLTVGVAVPSPSNVLSITDSELDIILPSRQKFEFRVFSSDAWSDWTDFKTRAYDYRYPASISNLQVFDTNPTAKTNKTIVVTNSSPDQVTYTQSGATIVNSQKGFNNITSITPTSRGATIVVND